MEFQFSFIHLQPTAWVQSLHTKRGANLRVNAKLDSNSDFRIAGVRSVAAIRTDLAFTRGKHDWQIPQAPEAAHGFLAYHSADEHIEFDFMSGGCSLSEEIYDDVWHRIKLSNYDNCHITVEVGPVELDYEETVWNRTASKFLYILDLELTFTRSEKFSSREH
jgi:hypothetical protein